MNLRRRLTMKERAVVVMFNLGYLFKQGHTVAFAEELVRQHGVKGLLDQSKKQGVIWTQLQQHFGEKNMHLVSAFSSFWNGCDYCAYGNLFAYNLHVFSNSKRLFPVDELEVAKLLRMRDGEVLQFLEQRLGDSNHADVLRLLRRQYDLKTGAVESETEEDQMLTKAVALYDWVNECSIVVDEVAPPFTALAKNKKLVQEYLAARKAWRQEHGVKIEHVVTQHGQRVSG